MGADQVSQNPHSSAPAIPRVRSSTTFVRLAAPETLQALCRSASRMDRRKAGRSWKGLLAVSYCVSWVSAELGPTPFGTGTSVEP